MLGEGINIRMQGINDTVALGTRTTVVLMLEQEGSLLSTASLAQLVGAQA